MRHTDPASSKLLETAQRYLQDRASRVTEQAGTIADTLSSHRITSALTTNEFATRTAAELPELDHLRATWQNTPVEYKSAIVSIQNPVFSMHGNDAEVFLYEKTDLYLSHPQIALGGPTKTSYRLGHNLTFNSVGDGWSLSSDTLDLPRDVLDPIPYFNTPRYSRQHDDAPPSSSPSPITSTPKPPPTTSMPSPSVAPTPLAGEQQTGIQNKSKFAIASPAYSRNEMANYATQWALGRNPNYRDYGNDCTNFVSQALSAGGWEQVRGTGPDDYYAWFYDDGLRFNSKSWSVADLLRLYAGWTSNPVRMYGYAGPLPRLGDLIWADWDDANGNPGTDGKMDHVMILSAYNPMNGNDWNYMYVSYHTTDTLNSPMAVVEQKAHARGPHDFYFFGHKNTP